MKIISINICSGKLGKQVIDLLKRENADIVCLQEAVELEGGRSFLFDDLDKIIAGTGHEYSFFTPNLGYRLMNRTAKMGLAILSKVPLLETYQQYLRLQYTDEFDLIDGDYNVQSIQMVAIEVEGQKYHILNYHGHHVWGHKNGNEETMRQCNLIAEYIKSLDAPVVLCGDFNLSPESESLEQINRILKNHVRERGLKTTRTLLTEKTEVCDYIFTSPELSDIHFAVLDDVASDHKALVIEV